MRNQFGSIAILSLVLACFPLQLVVSEGGWAQVKIDRKAEADKLLEQGNRQYEDVQFREALQSFEIASEIYNEIEDLNGRSNAFNNLGEAYRKLGLYQRAIEYSQQSLSIFRYIKDLSGEGNVLNSLAKTYQSLGEYQKAIDYSKQALAIFIQIKDRQGEGNSLNNLGVVYQSLGQYQKAIDYSKQALAISIQIKDRQGELAALNNLGSANNSQKKYREAIDYSKQASAIAEKRGNRIGEATAKFNWAYALEQLGQIQEARALTDDSIVNRKLTRSRPQQVYALGNLGSSYARDGDYYKAIEFYQRSLVISKQINDRNGEAYALSNLGNLFSEQKQPELAILFYKQSVNIRESIRKDNLSLSKEEQKSYLSTVQGTYRNLAELLLKQDRILEAQQVLDLLKIEELSEYLRSAVSDSAKKADYQPPEQNIIAFGIELDQLQKLDPLTKEQEQRLAYLTNQESNRNEQFNAFLQSPAVQKQIEQLRRDKAKNVDLEEYNRLRESLKEIKNAAIFYPLILDDRLELILITDTTTPIRKTINIKREALNKDISDFLISLRSPSSNAVQADAQKFYRYLIEPFEKELQDAKIETIIYAPDGQLRYIPLAALYDGKQWLVERYRINNITASSLTNLRPRPRKTLRVLAAAATTSQNIKFGDTSIPFGALPATKTEVEAIAALLPRTTTLIDGQFNKIDTLPKMQSNSIVHLATDGYFAIGKPEDSFIVFGDGDKATIADMKNWTLTNVELVVLSACETAIGSKVGSGIEIFGLGYQIHNAGVGAAIASLWKVSDGGTQKLMDAFYTALKTGKVSNIEALRQAQVAMITGNSEGLGEPRGQISVEMRSRNTSTVPPKISHPYYWAAFILIGNGL